MLIYDFGNLFVCKALPLTAYSLHVHNANQSFRCHSTDGKAGAQMSFLAEANIIFGVPRIVAAYLATMAFNLWTVHQLLDDLCASTLLLRHFDISHE